MKKRFLNTVIIVLGLTATAYGQGGNSMATLSFPDSVMIVLENTRNVDAEVVGKGFAAAWAGLGLDQQQIIRKQTYLMRKKKYPLRPHITNYFGAIVNAVTVEHADAAIVTKYLQVTGKVVENFTPAKALNFFETTRAFFAHHALHYEKTFRLYARDDKYSFDYIEPAPLISWDDTTRTESQLQPSGQELDSSSDETPGDTGDTSDSTAAEMPMWMQQTPPPVIEGPVIKFRNVTLNFVTGYDSVFLKNTKGTVSLTDKMFVGEGGSFDWSPAGLHPDSVFCNFTQYHFNITKPDLKVDVVKLNYVGKTPGFIPGTFEFRTQPRPDTVPSTFPHFKSFQSDLDIRGIADESVRYRGGFSLIGSRITSTSVSGEDATIEIYTGENKRLTAKANDFAFNTGNITATRAQVEINHGNDSITHPRVRFKYTYGDSLQRILLLKDKGELKYAPYFSSYYNIDFTADILRWDLLSDSLNLLTDGGRNIVPLIIESIDFYDVDDFRILKGSGFTFHPLVLLVSYYLKTGFLEFYAADLAIFAKKPEQEIKSAIDFLFLKGMINYDRRSGLVQIKQKAISLYQASRGQADYDNLKIHSITDSSANATINYKKGQMTIRGVDVFRVSDSLNVRIKADSAVITLLQNRDIKFDGTVTAGNFEISGKGFTLKYDSFFISLNHIDSINFFITEKNSRGQEVRRKINNSMVGADSIAAAEGGLTDFSKSSGTLFISRADNKSGREKIPNYPRLDATTGGVIYFDRQEVLGGVYDRSMFFVVPPFKLDSLNNADPAAINFEGTFVSSGMFPSFKDKLSTQPDKSLGFQHDIPTGGYQLYKGDGKMNGFLTMNNRGLRGAGNIEFLAANLSSPDFVFYPDSVVGRGKRATISEQQFGAVVFPEASLPDFEMKWLPKQDRMRLKNLKAPFNFYDSTAQMQGVLTISKSGLAGAGKLETRGTELISREMNFTSKDFGARHARFKVKSDDPNKNLLSGNDVRLKFNLQENYADVSPEIEGEAAIDFPYAQFKTSIPKARWNLNEQKIVMSKDPDMPIEYSYFYTTRKDLDSLSFFAESAEYDLKTQQLKVSGIPDITVADALITPENNEVLILENARIGTLKNTTIVLDTLNAYHRLTEGVVDIVSRKEFHGYATYQYVNFLDDTFAIKMTDFHLEPIVQTETSRRSRTGSKATMQTVATGSVTDKESLVLGAGMFYKGDMTMYATRPALQLNGFVKLDIRKLKNYDAWIKYTQTGDETDVLINFDNAVTEDGRRATAGLHFGSADNDLYISFLNAKKSDDDEDFFRPSGTLFYDTASHEYIIEDREKAAGNKLSGKVFAYKDETMQVRFEGPVNLFKGSKNFDVTSTAIGSGSMETNEIRMNSFLIVDTNIPTTAMDAMARNIQNVIKNEGAAEGLGDHTELLYKIADIVGEKVAKDFEQRSVQGYVPLATIAELARPIVLADVNMKWSQKDKAFYSEGLLGISNIGKNDINGGFEGFLEVKKNEDSGPVFHLFIKASPDAWYYFGFEDNRLLVHSSHAEFNSIVGKKTNAGKAKVGEVAFVPGSDDETLAFINRFRKTYFGIDVPYSLTDGTKAAEKKKDPQKKDEDDGF